MIPCVISQFWCLHYYSTMYKIVNIKKKPWMSGCVQTFDWSCTCSGVNPARTSPSSTALGSVHPAPCIACFLVFHIGRRERDGGRKQGLCSRHRGCQSLVDLQFQHTGEKPFKSSFLPPSFSPLAPSHTISIYKWTVWCEESWLGWHAWW